MERGSARVKVRFPAAKDNGSGTKWQLPGYGRQFLVQVTTYFFYDFPADRSVKDMWFCFWSFGKVADVFILARRDWRGRHFGFVCMSEVSEVKDMEQKLNQIWLGSYHLKVKLAGNMKREWGVAATNPNRQFEKKWIRRESKVTLGRTYAQVVAGNVVASEEGVSSNNDVRQVEITKGMEPVVDVVLETISERSTVPLTSEGRVEERSLDMVKKIQNRLDVDGLLVNVALLGGHHVILVDYLEGCLEEFISYNSELMESWFEWIQPMSLSTISLVSRLVWLRFTGVPLKAWSERCFTELGGLIGEVDGKAFPITVQEEEWRMDPDWCESAFNENGFPSEDGAVMAEERVATEMVSNFLLQKDIALNEEVSGENMELNGLETFGPSGGNFNGPHKGGEVEPQSQERSVEDGSEIGLEAHYVQSTRLDWTEKKRRSLGTIYAEVSGMEKPRKAGTSWVTARTKARRNRRGTDVRGEESQMESCSLSDGCIRRQNEVIGKQLQMDEVRELFLMGQNLGIQCQQNEEEVISRLEALEERDGVTFGLGNSGGLLSIWNKSNFVKERVIEGNGFIGISGEWGKQRLKCNLVNVYAPCDRQRKAMLWAEMGKLVLEEGGRWLLVGDFNAIRNGAERKGRLGGTQDMGDFNQFVEGCGLIDVRLRNRKFTWYKPDGSSMIILTSRNIDWGPKPFRVLDAWQQHPDFKCFVEDKWKTLQIEGWAAFQCKQKLKLIKEDCKGWNRGVFGNVETQLDTRLKHIQRLDKKSEEEELSENETRRAQNAIDGILGEEGWIEEPELIKAEAVKYFSKLFYKEQWSQPVMERIQFRKISVAQKEWLERPFSIEEIEEGLRSCDESKAPGPDGYNFNFIKFAWNTLKDDFVKFLLEFHQHGRVVWAGEKSRCEGLLKGLEIRRGGMVLSLLQFADDTVFMGKACARNLKVSGDVKGFKWKVGEGRCVEFWRDKWVGDKSLKDLFSRLFVLSTIKEGRLKDMGFWRGANWVWDCRWRCGCVGRAVGEEG
ncbi:hypothetical protein SLEP1_g53532 [Rubroshorea leprosula]|uniref:RRM domain-containing protein n=1 Tax=Rubroshorea leprosula TaxID=152421 RepID=A0AAV5MBH0_9ROSI|nr:hypothetical protein SLEP1_g53532 [Rubroshorea leprosula]